MICVLAFSIQDQIEKYGAYVGIASFLGLALLSVLYFAQAREVRRLRDWAGRAPELDREAPAAATAAAAPATAAGAAAPGPDVVPQPVNGRGGARPVPGPNGPPPPAGAAPGGGGGGGG